MPDILFQKDLAPAYSANTTTSCFSDNDMTVLDWPANLPVLNPENVWGIVKRKMRNAKQKKG